MGVAFFGFPTPFSLISCKAKRARGLGVSIFLVQCALVQCARIASQELAGIREEDEVTEAIDAMQKDSFHDSVQVVRDYTRYRHALDTLIVRKSIIAQGL